MSFIVVIPARLASERLPRKPLRELAGEPLVWHVHQRALESDAREVWIVSESDEVVSVATGFGANAAMTEPAHTSGTDRIAELVKARQWSADTVVVNLQGDEPLMPPQLIQQVAALAAQPGVDVATLAWPLEHLSELLDPNAVKVVCDAKGDALYFSRAAIPWDRDGAPSGTASQTRHTAALRHIGIYAYRVSALLALTQAPPCTLEQVEKLEQLRALHLGLTVRVGEACALPGPGVDTPDDLLLAQAAISDSAS